MARTLLDIDRDLLEAAKVALGQPTFTATVTEALKRAVAGQAWQRFLSDLPELDDEQIDAIKEARNRW